MRQAPLTEAEPSARLLEMDDLHALSPEDDPYRHARAAGSMKDDPFWDDLMQEIQDQRRRIDIRNHARDS